MLCKSRGVGKLTNHIGDHALWLETKLDGERMLCHKEGRTVQYFTRNARDYTALYGPVMTDTILRNVSQRGRGRTLAAPHSGSAPRACPLPPPGPGQPVHP